MKKIKKVVALILSIVVLNVSINVVANSNDVSNLKSESVEVATQYAEQSLDEIVGMLMNNENFTSRISEESEFELADPYIVYHVEEDVQECVYYFPIVDKHANKVVYLLEAIFTDGDYVVNALDHMVDELNEIDYVNNECIVYLMNEDIYIESMYDVVSVNEVYDVDTSTNMTIMPNNSFVLTTFSEKKQLITERMDELVEYSVCQLDYEGENLNINNYGSLELYSPQYQYGYGMCWACAVATVQNYINQRVVTGFEVCTRMSIGYDEGGNVYDEQEALAKYNVNYDVITASGLTWAKIVQNINAGYPIIANGLSSSGLGHAVTIYGYTGSSYSSGTVYIWNSVLTNGYAQLSNSQFTNGAGVVFDWSSSLSYY